MKSIIPNKKYKRKKTQKPLGPMVTETASTSLYIPANKPSLHSLSKEILLDPALTILHFLFVSPYPTNPLLPTEIL